MRCIADTQGVCTLYKGYDGSRMGRQAMRLGIFQNDFVWSACWSGQLLLLENMKTWVATPGLR